MSITAHEVAEKLKVYKNIILYGPPGTGKTHLLNQVLEIMDVSDNYNYYDTSAPISIKAEKNFSYEWCTFHPNYSYENFVIGLDPMIKDGKLGYKHHIGPFLNLVKKNFINENEVLLIIDEINRANTDDVFGDTIGLLEINNRDSNAISLMESVEVDGVEMNELKINDSFYVIGTMNSLDKSVNPLDYGIKRRFVTIEVTPDGDILKKHIDENKAISKEISEFVMQLFYYLNSQLREYVGKEYEFGQGYFWEITKVENNVIEVLSDILKYKVLPHLKDVFPNEFYLELLKEDNLNKLYHQTDFGYELMDVSQYNEAKIINLMAIACGSKLRLDFKDSQEDVCATSEEYESRFKKYERKLIDDIYAKLKRHKNVILAGCSGTGKSTIVKLLKERFYMCETMHWHSSTSYEDVLEGISASIGPNGEIDYNYKPGKVLNLIKSEKKEDTLMIIENIDKSSASENFGELITLLEPDKRESVSIKMHNNELKLSSNMHLVCTMNPLTISKNKLDSALKRRFIIIELYPDYELLRLWFDIEKIVIDKSKISRLTSKDEYLNLAIGILQGLNSRIIKYLGVDLQIGHAVFWNLKNEGALTITHICQVFDEIILPILQDYINDEETAKKIFGENSMIVKIRRYGIELRSFKDLNEEERYEVLKELYSDD